MTTVLNQMFGKQKQNYGNIEFWHGAERAGWLMKQGVPSHSEDCLQITATKEVYFELLVAPRKQDTANIQQNVTYALYCLSCTAERSRKTSETA